MITFESVDAINGRDFVVVWKDDDIAYVVDVDVENEDIVIENWKTGNISRWKHFDGIKNAKPTKLIEANKHPIEKSIRFELSLDTNI